MNKPIQDFYPENVAHCYGCGRLNRHGLQIRSFWDGEISVCTFRPRPYHTAIPGYVYGGLIASLIDCHATGTAAAEANTLTGREPGTAPPFRFITGTLNVKFIRPTPMGAELQLRGTIQEARGRKIEVVCLEMPKDMEAG